MEVRLQKFISEAGVASRRKAEELIAQGRVQVNNVIVTEFGVKIDPKKDKVKVNGKEIYLSDKKLYIALNKPTGYVSTRDDEKGRRTVIDLLPHDEYIYPVGRLDYNTSGLLLLTNDGEIANALIHPRYEIDKTYIVEIDGKIESHNLENLRRGIFLEDGKTAPAKIKILGYEKRNTVMEMIIHEGKNRQIRRMFEAVGHDVVRLKRIRIGEIELGDLPSGRYRYLTNREVSWLRKLTRR